MTLFGPGSRGGPIKQKAPRRVAGTPLRAVWRAVTTQTRPPCKTCLKFQQETWRDGTTPYRPRMTTRQVRVQGDLQEFYCDQHAEDRKLADRL